MAANDTIPDASEHPSTDEPMRRGQPALSGEQDDGRTAPDKGNSQLRRPTHSFGAFLWEIDPDTLGDEWIDTLPERYDRWRTSGDPNLRTLGDSHE